MLKLEWNKRLRIGDPNALETKDKVLAVSVRLRMIQSGGERFDKMEKSSEMYCFFSTASG